MYEDIGQRDRRSAVLLLAFVVVQAAYLVINIGVIRPPAPEAPIEDVRATVIAHAGTIRWLTLLALTSFFGLFLPGVYGLRERMHATHRGRDLVAAGALSIIMSVVLVVTVLGVLGLVPHRRTLRFGAAHAADG